MSYLQPYRLGTGSPVVQKIDLVSSVYCQKGENWKEKECPKFRHVGHGPLEYGSAVVSKTVLRILFWFPKGVSWLNEAIIRSGGNSKCAPNACFYCFMKLWPRSLVFDFSLYRESSPLLYEHTVGKAAMSKSFRSQRWNGHYLIYSSSRSQHMLLTIMLCKLPVKHFYVLRNFHGGLRRNVHLTWSF